MSSFKEGDEVLVRGYWAERARFQYGAVKSIIRRIFGSEVYINYYDKNNILVANYVHNLTELFPLIEIVYTDE